MKNCFQFPTLFKLQCIVPVIAVVISAVMGPSAAASPPGNEFSGDANRIAQRQVPVIRVLNEDAYPQKSDRELINEARSKTNNAQILINTFHFRNKTLNLAEELFNLQSERALLIQRWGIVVAGTFPQWFYKADNPATEAVLDAIRLQFTGSAYFTTLLATELSNAAIKAMLAVTPARIGRFYMTLPQPAVLRGDRWDMPAYGQPARLSMYVTPYSEGGDAFSACDVVVAVFNSVALSGKLNPLLQYFDVARFINLAKANFSKTELALATSTAAMVGYDVAKFTPFNAKALKAVEDALTAPCSKYVYHIDALEHDPVDITESQVVSVENLKGVAVSLASNARGEWTVVGTQPGAQTFLRGTITNRALFLGGPPITYPMAVHVLGNDSPPQSAAPPQPGPFEIQLPLPHPGAPHPGTPHPGTPAPVAQVPPAGPAQSPTPAPGNGPFKECQITNANGTVDPGFEWTPGICSPSAR